MAETTDRAPAMGGRANEPRTGKICLFASFVLVYSQEPCCVRDATTVLSQHL
jgi:hypothetical protein